MKKAAGFLVFRKINNTIEYLLLKASYGNYHWSPPKGHVDPGEDTFTTALRETLEEAGIHENDLKIYKDQTMTLNYQVRNKPKVVVYWLAELIDPETKITLSKEHTDLKWLSKTPAIELAGFTDFADMVENFDGKIKLL